jgi:hypothetical protein
MGCLHCPIDGVDYDFDEWVQPRTMEEVCAVLKDCAVTREYGVSPWWNIVHTPTRQVIDGPPEPFYHPTLQYTMMIHKRRWQQRADAEAALKRLREIAGNCEAQGVLAL